MSELRVISFHSNLSQSTWLCLLQSNSESTRACRIRMYMLNYDSIETDINSRNTCESVKPELYFISLQRCVVKMLNLQSNTPNTG